MGEQVLVKPCFSWDSHWSEKPVCRPCGNSFLVWISALQKTTESLGKGIYLGPCMEGTQFFRYMLWNSRSNLTKNMLQMCFLFNRSLKLRLVFSDLTHVLPQVNFIGRVRVGDNVRTDLNFVLENLLPRKESSSKNIFFRAVWQEVFLYFFLRILSK